MLNNWSLPPTCPWSSLCATLLSGTGESLLPCLYRLSPLLIYSGSLLGLPRFSLSVLWPGNPLFRQKDGQLLHCPLSNIWEKPVSYVLDKPSHCSWWEGKCHSNYFQDPISLLILDLNVSKPVPISSHLGSITYEVFDLKSHTFSLILRWYYSSSYKVLKA